MANNFFGIKHLKLSIYVSATRQTYVIEGLPITSTIEKTGGEGLQHARITVQGLSMENMEALTILEFRKQSARVNDIQLEAKYSANDEYSVVFQGNAICALPVINNNGVTALEIEAYSGHIASIKPTPPISVKEPTSASKLLSMFVESMNDGTTKYMTDTANFQDVVVQNCVFYGSPRAKAMALSKQIGCDFVIDNNTFIFRNFDKATDSNVVICKETGMIGYPRFTHTGVSFQCLYNPRLQLGNKVTVKSAIKAASADWIICKLTHKLDAFLPTGGNWMSDVETYMVGGTNPYGRGR